MGLKYYKWRDDVLEAEADRHKLGWIAQEVEEVFPKAVKEQDLNGLTDCKTLDKDQIYASLYGAVQKLMQVVENQEVRIKELESLLTR